MVTLNGKKVNLNDNLTKDFKVREFQSKDGNKTIILDMKMVNKLQALRDWLGVPITITSAYRSPSHNKRVGGAKSSEHTKGTAIDIQVKGYTPKEIARYGIALGFDGIGIYNTFTHLDTRGYKARWGDFSGVGKVKLKEKKKLSEVDMMTKQELKDLIRNELDNYFKEIDNKKASNYAKDSWNKATEKKIVDGNKAQQYAKRQELIEILDRLKLI